MDILPRAGVPIISVYAAIELFIHVVIITLRISRFARTILDRAIATNVGTVWHTEKLFCSHSISCGTFSTPSKNRCPESADLTSLL